MSVKEHIKLPRRKKAFIILFPYRKTQSRKPRCKYPIEENLVIRRNLFFFNKTLFTKKTEIPLIEIPPRFLRAWHFSKILPHFLEVVATPKVFSGIRVKPVLCTELLQECLYSTAAVTATLCNKHLINIL